MQNTKKSGLKAGLQFFVFLRETDRATIVVRSELKEIYNTEFKARNQDTKVPNFSTVLYALKQSKKIHVGRYKIRVMVREISVDQWHVPRRSQPQVVLNVEEHPAPDQPPRSAMEENMKAARDLTKLLKNKRSTLISNKYKIVISSDPDFQNGLLLFDVETEQHVVNVNVENTGTETLLFTYYTALHKLSCFTLKDEHKVTRKNPLSLKPGDRYVIQVHYQFESAGWYPVTLTFEFQQNSAPSPFYIVRDIRVHYLNTLGMELKPIAPFKRSRPAPVRQCALDLKVVEGVPPDALSIMALKSETPLYSYRTPKDITKRVLLLNEDPPRDKSRVLASPLSYKNYSQKFHELLYLEEHQMQVDIMQYFIPNNDNDYTCMEKDPSNKTLLILQVPGLSENRPSVLRGDRLLVYQKGEQQQKYSGYVHRVERDSVKLGFNSEFLNNFVDGMKFNVEFTFNRLVLRLQHRAVEFATKFKLENVLFPPDSLSSKQISNICKLSFYDRQLEKNPEQSKAVRHIVAGTSKPAPYLVFGPPGTGKTFTLVEAIKQIDKTQKDCHILACAPSNSATDLLCTRILKGHGNKGKVYRMYASSQDTQCVPEELKACSNLVGDGYAFPSKKELMGYRILVTTLFTAGRLVTGNLPRGHFTHIFVDEAGHATESECVIPLAGLLDPEVGQVVLAGDHKQLGPIVASPLALKYELGFSLLERLMNISSSVYQKDGVLNDLFVTKLLRNYRSHPAILKVPNELFYGGELQVCADEMKRNSFCKWEHLERPDFPVVFHGVTGMDEREANSPSFFNRAEVQVLMDYVKKLLQTGRKKGLSTISPKDIGIITPYKKQGQKIRQALNRIGKELPFMEMNALKVGSVEEFQGQERRVILLSTVRSNLNYTDFDKQFNLGFVANKKRFNVAMTRAQALLIVVGNPVVLCTDNVWNHFIKYCQDSEADRGYKPVEEAEAVAERLSSLYHKIHAQVNGQDEGYYRTEE
ncbi:putative helicase mov-10-B.2 isoform X1 [Phycodurus eques]|uniref:putative helicase mov-10-B.2 isoform X1 n=2 Tax=Phycodurus eques TaxID=693459 RepID=UPI002ACEA2F1|nr:putative helicase mov-10-B.2 isoform X1 [Phycodurus eques]